VWLDDLPVAVIDNTVNGSVTTSAVNYVTADQLGTPRAVSDGTGTVIWQWAYQGNPFGEQQPTSTTGYVLNLRYPGQYYDAESGFVHNGFRDYDPPSGRFVQSDPSGFNGGISLYVYGLNNPLMYVDPSGLQSTAQCLNPVNAAVCAAAGMAADATTGTGAGVAVGGATVGDAVGGTVLGGAVAVPDAGTAANTPCPNGDCDKLNQAVRDAKSKVGTLGKCMPGMSRVELQTRADAWLNLAISRARRDQKCWQGGDIGHQNAQADAWQNAAKCQGMLTR
jgi:RHS repeat-associated protein